MLKLSRLLNPDTPPTTLEEMYEMIKKITEVENGISYGFGWLKIKL